MFSSMNFPRLGFEGSYELSCTGSLASKIPLENSNNEMDDNSLAKILKSKSVPPKRLQSPRGQKGHVGENIFRWLRY